MKDVKKKKSSVCTPMSMSRNYYNPADYYRALSAYTLMNDIDATLALNKEK